MHAQIGGDVIVRAGELAFFYSLVAYPSRATTKGGCVRAQVTLPSNSI